MKTFKKFETLKELIASWEYDEYQEFWWLNQSIEQWKYSREDIKNAYYDVLLWEKEISNYNELHFQIKYLIDEIKISVNHILQFAELKFPSYKEESIRLINSKYFDNYEARELLMSFLDKDNDNGFRAIVIDLVSLSWPMKSLYPGITLQREMSDENIYNTLKETTDLISSNLEKWIFFWIKLKVYWSKNNK